MTTQEIFDKVAVHLLEQEKKAIRANGTGCGYRGRGGLTCAVGCLIPDDAYSSEIEGCVVGPCLFESPNPSDGQKKLKEILAKLDLVPHVPLLRQLQRVHDDFEPAEWRRWLLETASKFGLRASVPMSHP